MEHPGFLIRRKRQELGVSLRGLAQLTGIHHMVLHKLEKGQRRLRADDIPKLASALNLTPTDFLQLIQPTQIMPTDAISEAHAPAAALEIMFPAILEANKRQAIEYAFALAVLYSRMGDPNHANQYGELTPSFDIWDTVSANHSHLSVSLPPCRRRFDILGLPRKLYIAIPFRTWLFGTMIIVQCVEVNNR